MSSDASRDAEAAFAQFVVRGEQGETVDFEVFCAEHPQIEEALRELHRLWLRVRSVGQHAAVGGPATAEDEELPPASPSDSTAAELLQQLTAHTPATSRYKVRGKIGQGSMGAILRVWDEDLRRPLAMKVVLGKTPAKPGETTPMIGARKLSRFLEEAQVTGQLDHPGVVPVHELGVDVSGRAYFTMRLVKGRDLSAIFDFVASGHDGWNRTRALGVLLKACEALAYAHSKKVVHRDLKPANIMVGRFGEVYVMDWGLAFVQGRPDNKDIRLQDDRETSFTSVHTLRRDAAARIPDSPLVTHDGDVVGTPVYMSPEQARGKIHQVGPRSDVYAMGAILYHLLAGYPPYVPPGTEPTPQDVLDALLARPPRPLHPRRDDIPVELVAICEQAMARDPDRRYADMAALGDDLRAYLEQRVVAAHESGALAKLRKWVVRNQAMAGSLGAAAVLLVAGLAVVLTLQTDLEKSLQWTRSELKDTQERLQNVQNSELLAAGRALAAENHARRAQLQEALTQRRLAGFQHLLAFQELEDLKREAARLWPAQPAMVTRYDLWLQRAGKLVAGLDPSPDGNDLGHRRALEMLNERVQPVASNGGRAVEDAGFQFDSDEDRLLQRQLTQLVAGIEALADPRTGLIAGVSPEHGWGIQQRRTFASTVEERTVTGAEARSRWTRAITSIADPGQSPAYAGLQLSPQLGLLPMGQDGTSGLWEFWHVQSGAEPRRDSKGALAFEQPSGMVFVLVPGGRPANAAAVPPFFLSKVELTNDQWIRWTGARPGSTPHDATAVLSRFGLTLPSEAQWRSAARTGAATSGPGSDGHGLRPVRALTID